MVFPHLSCLLLRVTFDFSLGPYFVLDMLLINVNRSLLCVAYPAKRSKTFSVLLLTEWVRRIDGPYIIILSTLVALNADAPAQFVRAKPVFLSL